MHETLNREAKPLLGVQIQPLPAAPTSVSLIRRYWVVLRLLLDLRPHDFRAAATFIRQMYPDQSLPVRYYRFVIWALREMFSVIPNALSHVTFSQPVCRTPYWLAKGNPLANYPWQNQPDAALPESVEVVVIGAGFTGGALAYHWAKAASTEKQLVVLEMNDPASGASGRSAGEVVMGRYFALVQGTMMKDLQRSRPDLDAAGRDLLAKRFAKVYCHAAYKNAELIERAIREEGFDCDYVREGWIRSHAVDEQGVLEQSVRSGQENGFSDWTKLSPQEAAKKTGAAIDHPTGFSQGTAKFHPAKWVWSLFTRAIESPRVKLYCRTKVLSIRDAGEFYEVKTTRGVINAKYIVNATEAYTSDLHKRFHDVVLPKQTQMAAGTPQDLPFNPNVALSTSTGFMGRHESHLLFGSDETRIPDRQAECNQPSRFITKYLIGELRNFFGWFPLCVTHEWSGAVGFTRDEYPIVGIMDGKRQYIIAGMCGAGTSISFNAASWTCNRILGITEAEDDYPEEFFSPSRLLGPKKHPWPDLNREN